MTEKRQPQSFGSEPSSQTPRRLVYHQEIRRCREKTTPPTWFSYRRWGRSWVKNQMIVVAFAAIFFLLSPLVTANAQAIPASAPSTASTLITNLQTKIDQRNQDIQNLEKEIASYQKQLTELGTQSNSLSATLKSLQLTQKKLEADIKVTENRIIEKNLQIQQLGSQISDKEDNITDNRKIISRSFATMNEIDTKSIPELLLTKNSLSQAWNSLDQIATVQKGLSDRIGNLRNAKANLEENKKATEKAKAELNALGAQLKDQRTIVLGTVAEKNSLLKETKQSESEYQKVLAQRKALKESFESEISDLEASLKAAVDPASVTTTGKGVLGYPVSVVRITQYFGNTDFATKNPQVYNGQGHTGVDFAASVGTPIKSAADGIVLGSGNTDLVCPRASYGKWILVQHNNGLTTVYGHLSQVSAIKGQKVTRGEVIAYSGSTGLAFGPHLHFGVFASDGVAIGSYKSKSCAGAILVMPLLTKKNAYLNPLSYL